MKTIKQVKADFEDYKSLISAVINRVGKDSISDINNHGINGGYDGFIYYNETKSFSSRHRKLILQLLHEDADSFEVSVEEMVSGFGYFRNKGMDYEDKQDLYRYLSETPCKENTIPNLMAWYAAETVCRWFED